MRKVIIIATAAFSLCANMLQAQDKAKENLIDGLEITTSVQASVSNDKTPLWLNANKYGMSSLEKYNGHIRVAAQRDANDDKRKWKWGYGVDIAAAYKFTSTIIIQQAYAELRWKAGHITIGQKEVPMEFKDNRLSSGSQTFGINARPIPQVRISVDEYQPIHFLKDWVGIKAFMSYGIATDQRWQHEFTDKKHSYTDRMLYHQKGGYLRFGRIGAPFSVEAGIEMGCQFGGTPYSIEGDYVKEHKTKKGFMAFIHAFIPTGKDERDGDYANVAGNHVGSYLLRANYDAKTWKLSGYIDHFFEDHSGMFMMDFNGYGEGEEYQKRKSSTTILYKWKDLMCGLDLTLKNFPWLDKVVVEYIYSKYQSGPYNHDRTSTISDHVAGCDDYYNHSIYNAWQHWGQVIGNPLFRSPIYNEDGVIEVRNNRMQAVHLGLHGNFGKRTEYRVLATWQQGLGTYYNPYALSRHDLSFLVEVSHYLRKDWMIRAAWGMDHGKILGNNQGGQLTVAKKFRIKAKR